MQLFEHIPVNSQLEYLPAKLRLHQQSSCFGAWHFLKPLRTSETSVQTLHPLECTSTSTGLLGDFFVLESARSSGVPAHSQLPDSMQQLQSRSGLHNNAALIHRSQPGAAAVVCRQRRSRRSAVTVTAKAVEGKVSPVLHCTRQQ